MQRPAGHASAIFVRNESKQRALDSEDRCRSADCRQAGADAHSTRAHHSFAPPDGSREMQSIIPNIRRYTPTSGLPTALDGQPMRFAGRVGLGGFTYGYTPRWRHYAHECVQGASTRWSHEQCNPLWGQKPIDERQETPVVVAEVETARIAIFKRFQAGTRPTELQGHETKV